MKTYRIKHMPTGLYYNGFDDPENETGKSFTDKMAALVEFDIWVNMKFSQGTNLSDWEIDESDEALGCSVDELQSNQ